MNYLRNTIEMRMLPSGFEPEITALRGQYAWPDYTTGACKNENNSQFKAMLRFFETRKKHHHLHQ